ncbi:hypothetical protein ACOSQ2_024134 [Xanthoceras sorbifolium]
MGKTGWVGSDWTALFLNCLPNRVNKVDPALIQYPNSVLHILTTRSGSPRVWIGSGIFAIPSSTYLMLTIALKYKNVLSRLNARDRQYKNVPQENDSELASKLENNLRKFYEVTEMFSGTKYPTSNLLEVCEIRLSLSLFD